ncbi:MAG TPA: 1-aminocyclopropane-1-carboxylate deaminase/D-cysteine desulfhydrase [Saprospiraceae bacterium]|nr:1-aminocyclopropane-1-carboxylate deaminase/D-cysteine desulfhydrase [Saprospiraceae bacterium]
MPTPIQKIGNELLAKKNIQLFIKRDDLTHPQVSGNKFRKLKYNLFNARKQEYQQLLSFGGAFSNHIHALAAVGKLFDFKTIGIIRGERIEPLNNTLSFAEKAGMQLEFISRSDYRLKKEKTFQEKLFSKFGKSYLIPEGGTNLLAIEGAKEIVLEAVQQIDADYYCLACGTGGTTAGIIAGLQGKKQVLSFSALKGSFLQQDIYNLLKNYQPNPVYDNWQVQNDYHFGGFAKWNMALIKFINDFKSQHQIPLDPIYTGKLLFGIFDLIKKDYFPAGTKILAIHTGGLQGITGFNQRFGGADGSALVNV